MLGSSNRVHFDFVIHQIHQTRHRYRERNRTHFTLAFVARFHPIAPAAGPSMSCTAAVVRCAAMASLWWLRRFASLRSNWTSTGGQLWSRCGCWCWSGVAIDAMMARRRRTRSTSIRTRWTPCWWWGRGTTTSRWQWTTAVFAPGSWAAVRWSVAGIWCKTKNGVIKTGPTQSAYAPQGVEKNTKRNFVFEILEYLLGTNERAIDPATQTLPISARVPETIFQACILARLRPTTERCIRNEAQSTGADI